MSNFTARSDEDRVSQIFTIFCLVKIHDCVLLILVTCPPHHDFTVEKIPLLVVASKTKIVHVELCRHEKLTRMPEGYVKLHINRMVFKMGYMNE